MTNKLKFLDSFKPSIEVLTSTELVDEAVLDSALYKLMCSSDVFSMKKYVERYYHLPEGVEYTYETLQKKIRLKTIKLFQELNFNCKEFSNCYSQALKDFKHILNTNLRTARSRFNIQTKFGMHSNLAIDFDFNVYRQIISVSKFSDMTEIKGFDTKMLLLHNFFVKFMNEILEEIYAILCKYDIIEGKGDSLNYPKDFLEIKSKILSVCMEEKPKISIVNNVDKKAILKEYCHPIPSLDKNFQKLIGILEELRDRYGIPYECDKKKFAAIVYNLYRCQVYIGMRGNAFKTYTKFKNIMCSYFDMPQSTYKVNDIESISKILMRDLCFKDFELDAKWLTINGNEKKRKKRK